MTNNSLSWVVVVVVVVIVVVVGVFIVSQLTYTHHRIQFQTSPVQRDFSRKITHLESGVLTRKKKKTQISKQQMSIIMKRVTSAIATCKKKRNEKEKEFLECMPFYYEGFQMAV